MATRRQVLRHLALGLGITACRGAMAQPAEGATYVGIETSARGASRARFFSANGAALGHTALDFRAHGMAEHGARLVVFPRRPGDRFALIDKVTLEVLGTVVAPAERHFFGHGAFTRDGAHLIVPENDLETLGGALGVYDVTGMPRRVGTVTLPGPGPHEVIRAAGSDVFVVALGGLETHPAYGRTPLNPGTFRSQLVRYDFARGTVEPMGFWGGSEGVSLRHLAEDGAGRLYVGGQVPGDGAGAVLWVVENGAPTALPEGELMGGYVSSVAADGGRALVTSKVTGQVLELDGAAVTDTRTLPGASAVAVRGETAAVAGFTLLSLDGVEITAPDAREFDNHGLIY
ncbi:MAG: DUF1513 domain-containing protein [Pseudomonadota bacterium]